MTELPPRARLARLVDALVAQFDDQFDVLAAHPPLGAGISALRRLAEPGAAMRAAAACSDDEAAWIGTELRRRWERLGPVVLGPAAAIVGPRQAWVCRRPRRLVLDLIAEGLDPGWDVRWDGFLDHADGPTALLVAPVPEGPAPMTMRLRARVTGRVGGERRVLVADHAVAVRRPVVTVSDDRLRVVLCDQTGTPGVGVAISIGDWRGTSGAGGLVELAEPVPGGTTIAIDGAAAGRIPEQQGA